MQFTLADLWSHMGVAARLIVATMLIMSLMSLVVVFERLAALLSSRRASLAYARTMADLLKDGDMDRAASSPDVVDAGHLGRVVQAAFRAYRSSPKDDEDLVFESVARALERQAQREVHSMKRGVGVLASVGSTAPFVGLLGTVLGIVNSFEMMAATGSGGLATVSSGIAEALATTALGLVVAIPAVTAYNWLQSWIDARAVDISEASNELLDLLARYSRRNRGASAASRASTVDAQEAAGNGTEKRTLGLVFFESAVGIATIQPELNAIGGMLAQANGTQYIVAFGHDSAGNTARLGFEGAKQLAAAGIATRLLVEHAQVSVQTRADGTARILSALFSKKDRFPPASDPTGIFLTQMAAKAIPDLRPLPVADATGRLRLELPVAGATAPPPAPTAATGTWRPRSVPAEK